MIKKIDNKSIIVELDFDEYAVLRGYDSINEMMKYYNVYDEREAVVKHAELRRGYIDND